MEKYLIIENSTKASYDHFRVDKHTRLVFRPSPRLATRTIKLVTNYPIGSDKFDRAVYWDMRSSSDHRDLLSSSFNWHASISFDMAGSFHFKAILIDDDDETIRTEPIWSIYVVVNPELICPLDSIRCQTVLTKNLGPFKEWTKRLDFTKECNFNFIHLTPIQKLGYSKSAYSIYDHLQIEPSIGASFKDIKNLVQQMHKKYQISTITDIVLNHVSSNCDWIRQNPEGTYNLNNSKHLRPAFLIELAIQWLQNDLCSGLLMKTHRLGSFLKDERDVESVVALLKSYYLPTLKVYEFYMIDTKIETAKDLKNFERSNYLKINYDNYTRYGAYIEAIPNEVKDIEELTELIKEANAAKKVEITNHINAALNNISATIRYERLNPLGPYYLEDISLQRPLVAPYFTFRQPGSLIFDITVEESRMYTEGQYCMANNGWVMGADPLLDFASPGNLTYLRRELISWGDCIKLRYGRIKRDAPSLWDKMEEYVREQAAIFHGFRIDNCHSTPIHVAEYLLDAAREVRPDIYIMAELFTNTEHMDNLYVNRLGITSLIRESMSAYDAREFGRLMYRYGGLPVGAFDQHGSEQLKPCVAHAMFYDQTHDNESAILRRSPYDLQPTTSILNMAICATGSTRGYDELVPHQISVVCENRLYKLDPDMSTGLIPLRKLLNNFMQRQLQNYSEIFIDQVNDDIIAITRQNPISGHSIVLIARTQFEKNPSKSEFRTINIDGKVARILFEATTIGDPAKYTKSRDYINGLDEFKTSILTKETTDLSKRCLFDINEISNFVTEIKLKPEKFSPSSVIVIETELTGLQEQAIKELNSWSPRLDELNLNLVDANYILFRCPEEEGSGAYELPHYTRFTYCGLYGLMYYLEKVRENQDQAHPLAKNLREGDWLLVYIVNRLKKRQSCVKLASSLEYVLRAVDILPRGIVPKYFDIIITTLYNQLVNYVFSKMSSFISKGPNFVKLLALSSIALVGHCDSAPLPLHSDLTYVPSIAAGLPHFSAGYMRNWGRDTFISMRGLLLITGRHSEAREIILSYARALNYGLIPNLLDKGENSRYNCRDAVWWWLYSIKEYVSMAPKGEQILNNQVQRIHKPMGVMRQNQELPVVQPLYEVIQEAIELHFQGLEFIEANAGPQLDEHMTEEGFKVKIGVNLETGFIFGGNKWNCGTWMDKMGSSDLAGNRGRPATPRDGSAIELVALCYAVINWLDTPIYPYDGVQCLYDGTITMKWTWKKWSRLIEQNFEKNFYVPEGMQNKTPGIINQQGIYKDTFGASEVWQDFQFRPNFLVAMVIAPELFNRYNAKQAILLAREILCGPLGMKTLDPNDWNYCGDYDNGVNTTDAKIANGFNYHNGPEWLWLTGYYIRASTIFIGRSERAHHLTILASMYSRLRDTPWLGLPELTNTNGSFCKDSCPIQAWSVATILEALYEHV